MNILKKLIIITFYLMPLSTFSMERKPVQKEDKVLLKKVRQWSDYRHFCDEKDNMFSFANIVTSPIIKLNKVVRNISNTINTIQNYINIPKKVELTEEEEKLAVPLLQRHIKELQQKINKKENPLQEKYKNVFKAALATGVTLGAYYCLKNRQVISDTFGDGFVFNCIDGFVQHCKQTPYVMPAHTIFSGCAASFAESYDVRYSGKFGSGISYLMRYVLDYFMGFSCFFRKDVSFFRLSFLVKNFIFSIPESYVVNQFSKVWNYQSDLLKRTERDEAVLAHLTCKLENARKKEAAEKEKEKEKIRAERKRIRVVEKKEREAAEKEGREMVERYIKEKTKEAAKNWTKHVLSSGVDWMDDQHINSPSSVMRENNKQEKDEDNLKRLYLPSGDILVFKEETDARPVENVVDGSIPIIQEGAGTNTGTAEDDKELDDIFDSFLLSGASGNNKQGKDEKQLKEVSPNSEPLVVEAQTKTDTRSVGKGSIPIIQNGAGTITGSEAGDKKLDKIINSYLSSVEKEGDKNELEFFYESNGDVVVRRLVKTDTKPAEMRDGNNSQEKHKEKLKLLFGMQKKFFQGVGNQGGIDTRLVQVSGCDDVDNENNVNGDDEVD